MVDEAADAAEAVQVVEVLALAPVTVAGGTATRSVYISRLIPLKSGDSHGEDLQDASYIPILQTFVELWVQKL